MTREEILQGLNEVFQEVFADEGIALTESTGAEDIDEWDSLSQIELIMAIEAQYSMKFSIDEAQGIHTVGDMIDIIEKRKT